MITREDLERREEQFLAPYAAKSGRTRRLHPEPEHPYRTAFQRDRDRVIHSSAFRRLQYKTQVFVNHEGDYYRTRLTHSTEAAQIARTIARATGLNEDLCEVLALSHDLGHTPFGHSGQDALDECMKEHGGFEHNRQSLRVVMLLERRYPEFPGLNLTFETLESIAKHGERMVDPEWKPDWAPLLEAQVVDIADSIAYDAHDLDDGLKAGLLTEAQLRDVTLWRESAAAVRNRYPSLEGKMLARQSVLQLINAEVTDLVDTTLASAGRLRSLEEVRAARGTTVTFSPELGRKKRELQAFLYTNVYRHHRVVIMAEKARKFITELFRAYQSNTAQLPPRFQEWAREVGVPRAVADYIAGMTDRYAQEEYRKLFYPFENIL